MESDNLKLCDTSLENLGTYDSNIQFFESKKRSSQLGKRQGLEEMYAPVAISRLVTRTLDSSISSVNQVMTAAARPYEGSTRPADNCLSSVFTLNEESIHKSCQSQNSDLDNYHNAELSNTGIPTGLHEYTSVSHGHITSVSQEYYKFDTPKAVISVANDILDPKQTNKTVGTEVIDILDSDLLHIDVGKIIDDAPKNKDMKTSLIEQGIQFATGVTTEKIIGMQDGGILQTVNGILPTSAFHMMKRASENEMTGIQTSVMADGQSAVLGSCLLNKIGEAAFDHVGLSMDKLLNTANEVVAVTEAVKHEGSVTAILEDEHVQELGKKALGFGLEMATSAIMTASGAGAVTAVASAASDVITAVKEVKEMEDSGKHGMASFILETGAKIALKAAMKGSGGEAALSIAAPILEPLSQKVVDNLAQHGIDFMDQAVADAGIKNTFVNSADVVIRTEEKLASLIQSKVEGKLAERVFKPDEAETSLTSGAVEGSHSYKSKMTTHADSGFKPPARLNATQETMESEQAKVAIDKLNKSRYIVASSFLGCLKTTTAVSDAFDGEFKPIQGGMELLRVLYSTSDSDGLCMIDDLDLSHTVIGKIYEWSKNGLSVDGGKNQSLFDPDGDGIVHYGDTVRALAFLGLSGFAVRLAAYNFHIMFSYPTSDGIFPKFHLSLPIRIKNMDRTAQGRNWGTLDRARFLGELHVKKFFSEDSSKIWLMGAQGLQTLLFLFEWGTMWPFQLPSGLKFIDDLENIGPILVNVIIPFTLDHWARFQSTKSQRGSSSN